MGGLGRLLDRGITKLIGADPPPSGPASGASSEVGFAGYRRVPSTANIGTTPFEQVHTLLSLLTLVSNCAWHRQQDGEGHSALEKCRASKKGCLTGKGKNL